MLESARVRRQAISLLAILAYGLLEVAVVFHRVQAPRTRVSEILLFLAMAAMGASLFLLGRTGPSRPEPAPRWDFPLLLLLAVLEAGLVVQLQLGIDIGDRGPLVRRFAAVGLWTAAVFSVPYLLWALPESGFRSRFTPKSWRGVCLFLLGMGCALKIMGILAEAKPGIDVWDVLQAGANNLAEGKNPYSTAIPEAVASGKAFGPPAEGYVYPPAMLLLSFPFVKLGGDVRYLYVFTDTAAALLLLAIGGFFARERLRRYGEIAALLVMFHPNSFAKAWTDPVALPFLFLFALLMLRRPGGKGSAIVAGVLLSLKQYLVLLAPLVAVSLRRLRPIAIAGLVILAIALPFILWDPAAIWRVAGSGHLQYSFRADTMGFSSFLHHTAGVRLPSWFGFAGAAALLVLAMFFARRRGLLGMAAWGSVIYLFQFAGSYQVFPNYYHFVMGLILLSGLLALAENEVGDLAPPELGEHQLAPTPLDQKA
jgi:hypothetical protein